MVLRIAARRHVEDDAAVSLVALTGVEIAKAQLRLADAGGSGHDRQRAGQQSTAQMRVEFGDACALARNRIHPTSISAQPLLVEGRKSS